MSSFSILFIWSGFKEMDEIAKALEKGTSSSSSARVLDARRFDRAVVLGDCSEETLQTTRNRIARLPGNTTPVIAGRQLADRNLTHKNVFQYTATEIATQKETIDDMVVEIYYLVASAPYQIATVWAIMSRMRDFAGRLLDSTPQKPLDYIIPESWALGPGADTTIVQNAVLDGMYGSSQSLLRLKREIEKAARYDFPVLIQGESGTGKELVARALHDGHPKRSRKTYTPINCSAIAESLFEDTLFGHVRGAYSDAKGERKGLLGSTDGGTLFLDEIGDLPLAQQTKMLRLIEGKGYAPLGSDQERFVDVRFIAATHRDLGSMADSGAFRNDLYQRLNYVTLRVPSLRERPEDIPELVRRQIDVFVRKNAGAGFLIARDISPEALERLQNYRWPGNVRQLYAVITGALVFAERETIGIDDIERRLGVDKALTRGQRTASDFMLPPGTSIKEYVNSVEKACIEQAVAHVSRQSELTRELGLDNDGKTSNLLRKHGIMPEWTNR